MAEARRSYRGNLQATKKISICVFSGKYVANVNVGNFNVRNFFYELIVVPNTFDFFFSVLICPCVLLIIDMNNRATNFML